MTAVARAERKIMEERMMNKLEMLCVLEGKRREEQFEEERERREERGEEENKEWAGTLYL